MTETTVEAMPSDKLYCVNCRVTRPKSEWRSVPLKGRNGTVKRCLVCLRKKALRTAEIKKVANCS